MAFCRGETMDLGRYIKKSNSNNQNIYNRPKRCMQCGKDIDRERAGHLYYQSFCCHACKERYVGRMLD